MLKSTSRQILEITNTDHPYFERAFFVVRHDCTDQPPEKLSHAAQQVLGRYDAYSGIRYSHRRQLLSRLLALLVGGLLGAAVALLFSLFP